MIRIDEKKNDCNESIGFHVEGHAGFAKKGNDVVCAAISALAINCINSIELFTDTNIKVEQDEKKGIIDFTIMDHMISQDANLLLISFFFGVSTIQKEYGTEYVEFIMK